MATDPAQPKTSKAAMLTREEVAALDKGLHSEQNEPIYKLDEALEIARQRRKAWKKFPIESAES